MRCMTLTAEPKRWNFALSGSSARRLRRAEVNLLGGRVVMRQMLPLTAGEIGSETEIAESLRFGGLPLVASKRAAERIDLLKLCVETYLTQGIRARRWCVTSRALPLSQWRRSRMRGHQRRVACARCRGRSRPTVQGYFEVLTDTLLGAWLPAWRPRAKVKEVAHPKFYLFDCGVARALARRLREPLDAAERGTLLETLVFHELRAQMASRQTVGGELACYRTPSGTEIDFIWTRARAAIGIEVKASERWRPEFARAQRAACEWRDSPRLWRLFGDRPMQDGAVRVLPIAAFCASWPADACSRRGAAHSTTLPAVTRRKSGKSGSAGNPKSEHNGTYLSVKRARSGVGCACAPCRKRCPCDAITLVRKRTLRYAVESAISNLAEL